MKRFTLLVVVFVLILGMAGCMDKSTDKGETPKTEVHTEAAELTALKEKIKTDNKLIGVAYLGWIENDAEWAKEELSKQEYIKDISFVKDIEKYTEYEGYRMYAIVPCDDSVTVTVCKCEFDDEYMPCGGEELISANEPIIIRGNMSDTIPNLYVIAEKGSEKVEYTPMQSGMDGRLENNENKVYDFTPYSLMPEFSDSEASDGEVYAVDPKLLHGEWKITSTEVEGDITNAEDAGINSEIIIAVDEDDMTAKYYFSTEYKTKRFEAELELMEQPVYDGCGNDVWSVKFHTFSSDYDADNEFYATLIDENTLLLQNFFPFDGAQGVSYQTYTRK